MGVAVDTDSDAAGDTRDWIRFAPPPSSAKPVLRASS